MSKTEHLPALLLPTLTPGLICGGIYLCSTGGAFLIFIGIALVLAGILSILFYAKKLHGLPEARLINSPETDMIKRYMRGGLIASFIPQAVTTAVFIGTYTLVPNDGVSILGFIGMFIAFVLFPFFWYPVITYICLIGPGVGMDEYRIWGILLIVCMVTRTLMQSMCFLATNKRIDYCNSRVNGIVGSMFGTINIIFWLDSLSKVKKFAKIELEKGITA
ncbi:MAG: hypothetical protein IJ784_10415 [Ruminiclostridium sp.]|nr:hypothetical protein [Ruminiclostridium sp.]